MLKLTRLEVMRAGFRVDKQNSNLSTQSTSRSHHRICSCTERRCLIVSWVSASIRTWWWWAGLLEAHPPQAQQRQVQTHVRFALGTCSCRP